MVEFQLGALREALPFTLLSFLFSLGMLFLLQFLRFSGGIQRRNVAENVRSRGNVPRWGGVALGIAFWAALFFGGTIPFSSPLQALFVGSILILIVGIWDDRKPLSWSWQFIFQIVLVSILVVSGIRIEIMQGIFGGTWDFREFFIPGAPILLVGFWVVLIMNSLNWLDGLDGLLGSVSIIGSLSLCVVSLLPEVRQPALTILSLTLMGALVAFLLFNWPPARLVAGTTGSYFLGFLLASLSIFAGAKVATALLVLTVPILDALYVIFERLRAGRSPFLPDEAHLHFRLREYGWSDKKILFLYSALTSGMAFLALFTHTWGKLLVFIAAGLLFIAAVSFLPRSSVKTYER